MRRPCAGWAGLAFAAIAAVAIAPGLRADDAGPVAASAARLSSVEGQVRIAQGGQVLADQAPLNAPLFAGSEIQTGDDGKAEIQFEDGSVARLSPDSSLMLTVLAGQGAGATEIVLESGLGYFELGGGQGSQMLVHFADSVASASGFTVLRIHMDKPPGELAVFSGNAHLDRGNLLSVDLHGGESVTLSAADPSRYNLAESIEPDSWDTWNSDRDQALNAAAAQQTGAAGDVAGPAAVSPAWNDLDAGGNWYNVPGQGYIWSPYEAANAGWDPYGVGSWMWMPGYGYIWTSGYPWGFMPYQCGLWNYYNGFGWGWSPGMNIGWTPAMGIGSCRPWWGGGRYGVNIGAAPYGYLPIQRPILRGRLGHNPLVPVNRLASVPGGGLPARTRNTPVQIAGYTVQPLRAQPSEQARTRAAAGYVYRPSPGNESRPAVGQQNGSRTDYQPARPSYSPAPALANTAGQTINRPVQNTNQPARTYTPPPSRNSEPPTRTNSGGNYSGGGGAAASHPSGGGGGAPASGGGGNTHSSGSSTGHH